VGNVSVASYSAPEVSPGLWLLAPALRGPFDGPASGKASTGLLARTRAFDPDVTTSTGDIWQQTIDPTARYSPLTLKPGQSGTIRVRFTPQGSSGTTVQGTLYLDDFSNWLLFGNEQLAIPYSYTIR
jgi:hypothetical protein